MNPKLHSPKPCDSKFLIRNDSKHLTAPESFFKLSKNSPLEMLDYEEEFLNFKKNLTIVKQQEEIHDEIFSILYTENERCKTFLTKKEKENKPLPPRVSNSPENKFKN